jgi:hypothetical protein
VNRFDVQQLRVVAQILTLWRLTFSLRQNVASSEKNIAQDK